MNKPIGETRDDNGFTVVRLTDFLLKFIKRRDCKTILLVSCKAGSEKQHLKKGHHRVSFALSILYPLLRSL